MTATTSSNRLGEWLSEVFSVASEVKSIISATPSATSATATSNPASSDPASSSGTTNAAGIVASPSTTGSSPTIKSTAASSSTPENSNTAIATGTSTTNGVGSSVTSAASSASSTAAAAAHHHHSNLLPIILGTVLGGLALIALALCIFCCLRRRRSKKRSKRVASIDEDDLHSWRTHDTSTQPMMAGAIVGGTERHGYPNNPPPMAQHPAYRNLETGSSNPFVPPVPPPRKSAPNARPGLTTDSVPGQEPFTSSSPKRPSRIDPLAAGIAGLTAGAAAGKLTRKPINRSPHRLETTDLPEAVEPIDGSPNRYGGYNYGQSPDQANWRSSGGYDPRIDPRQSYGHNRQPSNQPLISESGNGPNPMSYTEDRPPTPFGLMGMGTGVAAAGAATAHHRDRQQYNSSRGSSDRSRESYDSAMAYPPPARSPHRHQTPPSVPSRSPRRARFSDPIEMASPTQSYHHSSTQSGGSNYGPAGRDDYVQPGFYHHQATASDSSRTNSGDSTWRLSSSMPGGWGGHTRESSRTSYPNPSPPTPSGKRMRLSDLRAREEEMERLKDHEGWDEQAAYGRGGHGGSYDDPDHGVGMAM